MQNQIHNLLTELKDSSRAGRVDASFAASLREELLKQSLQTTETIEQPRRRAMVDFVARIPGELTDVVARPMALASLLVAMVLGGWITGVNASLDTVPGDALYGVKLVSEKAQLTLASSNTRAKLYDEFASRRLDEVEQLIHSGAPASDGRVQTALDGFQKQIDGVEATLEKAEDDQVSVELARIIDEQSEGLEVVLELTESVQDEETRDVVAGTITETEELQGQVVETLAETADDSQVSRLELERQYTEDFRDMRLRSELLVERIDRVERALDDRGEVELAFSANQLRYRATDVDLVESQSFAAKGIYPEAFILLGAERDALRVIADELLQIEIQLSAPESVKEEAAPEGEEPTEEAQENSASEPSETETERE